MTDAIHPGMILLGLVLLAGSASGQPVEDPVDEFFKGIGDALVFEPDDQSWQISADLWINFDLYTIDQRPPAILFGQGNPLIAPRFSAMFNGDLGDFVSGNILLRVDRGLDPGENSAQVRMDEYFITLGTQDFPEANFRIGKFASCFGSWNHRHFSFQNSFVNAPLVYDSIITLSDRRPAPNAAALARRKTVPDNKAGWIAPIWGPDYTTGMSLFGRVDWFDYTVEVKNAPLSARVDQWDITERGFRNPTFNGHIGFHPNAAWTIGISGSTGPYLEEDARLPDGASLDDYTQTAVGLDVAWSHGWWEIWSEFMFMDFDVYDVGNADLWSYYFELKRKLTSDIYVGARWNQMFFNNLQTPTGTQKWENNMWRIDLVLGINWNRSIETKFQYTINHQQGPLQQGEQMFAFQTVITF